MKRLITILMLLGWAATMAHSWAAASDEEIQHLLQYIKGSPIVLIRNGKEHTPTEAAEHIARKRDHFKDQIATTEDFIRLAATKSEASGKPYLVKTADGKTEALAMWLTRELERYRKEKKQSSQPPPEPTKQPA